MLIPLIPPAGREIQCGSCNHVWFYNPNLSDTSQIELKKEAAKKNLIEEPHEKKRKFRKKT